jgi:steroid Delta-isomerase
MTAAVKAHCRTLSAGDKRGWLELWAEDAVLEDPVGVDTYSGKATLASTFWGLVEELQPMIGILNGVVTRGGQLTRVGPIVDHFVFNAEGKIASMRAFWKYA